jgi:hypothetical protein
VKKKRPHKKPIGDLGPVRVTNAAGEPIVQWMEIDLPTEKMDQETAIARAFCEALNAREETHWSIEHLPENDFDCLMTREREKRYLELQEIVIPPKKRGSPYRDREQVIYCEKFADTIVSEMRQKISKYTKSPGPSLDLLLYITHWRFQLNAVVYKLLGHYLKHNTHRFAHVFAFTMLDEQARHIEKIFPNDEALQGFDPATAKKHWYANLDPGNAQPFKDGGRIGVRLPVSPETLRKLRKP